MNTATKQVEHWSTSLEVNSFIIRFFFQHFIKLITIHDVCVHDVENECDIVVNKVRLSARTLRSSNGHVQWFAIEMRNSSRVWRVWENMCAETKACCLTYTAIYIYWNIQNRHLYESVCHTLLLIASHKCERRHTPHTHLIYVLIL